MPEKQQVTQDFMEKCGRELLKKSQIAMVLGVSPATLSRILNEDPKLDRAYHRGLVSMKTFGMEGLTKLMKKKPSVEGFARMLKMIDEQVSASRVSQREIQSVMREGGLGDVESLVRTEVQRLREALIEDGHLSAADSRLLERYSRILIDIQRTDNEAELLASKEERMVLLDVTQLSPEQRKKRLQELEAKRTAQNLTLPAAAHKEADDDLGDGKPEPSDPVHETPRGPVLGE